MFSLLCSSCSWGFPLQFVKDLPLGFHPISPYFRPSPKIMSTREDCKTSTTKTELRLHQPLRHLRQVFSRHLRLWTYGIFAYFPRVRLHGHLQQRGDQLRARATLPSSEAPQERWPSMGNSHDRPSSLRGFRRWECFPRS